MGAAFHSAPITLSYANLQGGAPVQCTVDWSAQYRSVDSVVCRCSIVDALTRALHRQSRLLCVSFRKRMRKEWLSNRPATILPSIAMSTLILPDCIVVIPTPHQLLPSLEPDMLLLSTVDQSCGNRIFSPGSPSLLWKPSTLLSAQQCILFFPKKFHDDLTHWRTWTPTHFESKCQVSSLRGQQRCASLSN